jgi:hypothetical protein
MQESSAALRAQVGELRYDCSGRLQYQEDILNGIEQASVAIAGLYRGAKFGKRLIHPYCAVVVAISSEGTFNGTAGASIITVRVGVPMLLAAAFSELPKH